MNPFGIPGLIYIKNDFLRIKGISDIYIFLFLHEYMYYGYVLEDPLGGASNEYPQHMFSRRNKKNSNIFV